MIKNISTYTLISIITAIMSFITILYMSRLLSPVEYAFIGLFGTIFYILSPILSLNTIGLVGINLINLDKIEYADFINKYISFIIFISIIVFAIVVISSYIMIEYQLLFLLSYFVAIFIIFINIHNVELIQHENIKQFGFYKIVMAILNLFFVFIFVEILDFSWEGRLIGFIVTNAIVLILMWNFSFSSLRYFKFQLKFISVKEYLKYGYPLVIGLGAAWMTTQLDKIIVLNFFTLEDLGYYSMGYAIGFSFTIINQSMVNAISPKVYTLLKNGERKDIIYKYSFYYNIFISLLVLIGVVFIYNFGTIILGEEYKKSIDVILLVMIAVAFDGMYRVYGLVLNYYKENVLITKLSYSIVFFNIFFSFVLLPYAGLLAPAIGTIISYILGYILSRYFAIKILNTKGVK